MKNKEIEKDIENLIIRYSAKDDFKSRESFAEFIILNLEEPIKKIASQATLKEREKIKKLVEKTKISKVLERDFEIVPNKRGIWYAGFSEAKRKILNQLK